MPPFSTHFVLLEPLIAAGIIALHDEKVRKKLIAFRRKQTADVKAMKLP